MKVETSWSACFGLLDLRKERPGCVAVPRDVSALDENAPFEGEELGDEGLYEDDWSADTWSEAWWSDDLVAAVFADGT